MTCCRSFYRETSGKQPKAAGWICDPAPWLLMGMGESAIQGRKALGTARRNPVQIIRRGGSAKRHQTALTADA